MGFKDLSALIKYTMHNASLWLIFIFVQWGISTVLESTYVILHINRYLLGR